MFEGLTYQKVFSKTEIELISTAYKMQLKEIIHGIRTIDLLETKSKFSNELKLCMEKYRLGLIYDLCSKGKTQIDVLEEYCVKTASSPLYLVHFLKMQADIYRYLAEHTQKYHEDVNQKDDVKPVNLRDVLPEKYLNEIGVQENTNPKDKIKEPLK